MTITQTVEIPASHRLIIDVPREVPEGPVILTFTPAQAQTPTDLKAYEDGLIPAAYVVGDECPICAAHNYTLRPEIMEEILEEERAAERGEITYKRFNSFEEMWEDLMRDDPDDDMDD